MGTTKAELRPHPRDAANAVRRVAVEIEADGWPRTLRFRFRLEGETDRLKIANAGFARRIDGLWQHTCFEAFLRPDGDESYHEFNFSPSGDWAAYRFAGRRSGRSSPELAALPIASMMDARHLELTAEVPTGSLPGLAGARALRAGIATIVESADGALAHWALAHPPGAPDFHDPASFTLAVTLP